MRGRHTHSLSLTCMHSHTLLFFICSHTHAHAHTHALTGTHSYSYICTHRGISTPLVFLWCLFSVALGPALVVLVRRVYVWCVCMFVCLCVYV
jgi:hypothetical protein